uniref:Reverse transcriptase domain-containing protein n=1 Tax=Cannabis sativa TaxID=3483 RepID=A0A803Q9L8_CANSA
MASSSRIPNDIEDICANLCLEEEEDDIITLGQSIQKVDEGVDTRWCLVGTFVQDHQMDFDTIQHQLASLWKPGMGMFCKELGQNRYLFQFFHDVDINRVIEGSPWTCLRKLLIFNRLTKNDDPRTIPLNKLDIWIQIFDMQPGYMSARVVQDVGNRIGVFIESDPNNFKGFWRNYLRIRVTINIEKPLRRKMKISPEGEDSFWFNFKYECAPTFCFICGIIGHTENFCAKLFQTPLDQIVKPYGIWMKATPIQQNKYIGSKWLRNVGWEPGLASGGSTFNRNASATNMVTDSDAELDETSNDPRLNSNPINQGGNQDMITGMRIGNHNTDFSPSQPPAASFNANGMKKQGLIITDIKRRRTEDMVDAEVEVISVDDSVGQENQVGQEAGLDQNHKDNGLPKKRYIGEFHRWNSPHIMSILSWNCCGLGNQRTKQFIIELHAQKRPNFIFLCETLCKKNKVEEIKNAIGFDGAFIVEAQGHSGGLALLWQSSDEVRIIGYSNNHIDCIISKDTYPDYRLTGIYGEPNRSLRRNTWQLIRTLHEDNRTPWCLIGDFNNVTNQADKKGGHPYPSWLIEGFQKVLSDCSLNDLPLLGYQFTWERGHGSPNWIEARIDRALASHSWLDNFQLARLLNIEVSTSDHCPLLLDPCFKTPTPKIHCFCFENAWIGEPMCEQIIRDIWDTSNHLDIQSKISLCGDHLLCWGKDITGSFKERINDCKAIIKKYKGCRDLTSVQLYKNAQQNLNTVLAQKEAYWTQRSKQLWLTSGDQNTKFFHKAATTRRRTNQIRSLKDNSGVSIDWDNGLANFIQDYFSNIFTASESCWEHVMNCLEPKISAEQNSILLQPISAEEIKHALFQMHPDKSPGPDGMSPAFYQKFWHIIGNDVIKTVQNFFTTGCLPVNLNDTNVVLIPKKKKPELITEMRPISLCNVLYKVISKVLTNRMKHLMGSIISENQSAFIPGCLITDNIMISFEVLHYLKRRQQGKEGVMALKLDLSKAFDRIEWAYLNAMLLKLGFDEKWVSLIHNCLSSVKYKVICGNHETNIFCPTRGIRQGDPLSPYLFLVCAEGLSALIRKFEARAEIDKVKELLLSFEKASGQQVNFNKSSAFFSSNTSQNSKALICNSMGISEATEDSKYLGLPSTLDRNKNAVLGFLKDKMQKRIQSWDGKFLSRAGKEVMIKSVLQSVPSYAMNVFLLSKATCNQMETLMNRFWWQSKGENSKGIHWKSWKNLSKSKSKGGMGFRNLRDFNLAILGKQGWRLLVNHNSLVGRIFKARYFPNTSFFNSEIGGNPSFIWRSIFETKNLVLAGCRKLIGSGTSVSILNDPWLPAEMDGFIHSSHPALLQQAVSSLLQQDVKDWDIDILNDLFNDRDKDLILQLQFSPTAFEDSWYWLNDRAGIYTVKIAYHLLQQLKGNWGDDPMSIFWNSLWKLQMPPRVRDLLWRACSNSLPTKVQPLSRHVSIDTTCSLCQSAPETSLHLFVNCPFAQNCLRKALGSARDSIEQTFAAWFQHGLSNWSSSDIESISMLCWALWRCRNDFIWNNTQPSVDKIISSAKLTLDQWKSAQSLTKTLSNSRPPTVESLERWTKPTYPMIKVNVDGATFAEQKSFGWGFVARDHDGSFLKAHQSSKLGLVRADIAEAVAIKEALSWIKANNWQNVQVESDCLNVVSAINSKIHMFSPYGSLINDSKNLLSLLFNVSVSFVKRSANNVTHFLARDSYSKADCTLSGTFIPANLSSLLLKDLD